MPGEHRFWPRPFWPPRNWWLALLVILVLAGALRFPGYGFSLPYIDQPDEPNFLLFRAHDHRLRYCEVIE